MKYEYDTTAEAFVEANDQSPVIIGEVIGVPDNITGVLYILKNGTMLRISSEESRKLPANYPIWAI